MTIFPRLYAGRSVVPLGDAEAAVEAVVRSQSNAHPESGRHGRSDFRRWQIRAGARGGRPSFEGIMPSISLHTANAHRGFGRGNVIVRRFSQRLLDERD